MRSALLYGAAAILVAMASPTSQAKDAKDGSSSVGFVIRDEAKASDLGVPIYPGAVPRRDKEDDRSGLTLAAWGGDNAFKIAVLKLTSEAPVDAIAGFYRDALGRFGDVLDCSKEAPSPRSRDDVLTCEEKDTKQGSLIYKVGTPRHQHLVKIRERGSGVHIDIVRIDAGG